MAKRQPKKKYKKYSNYRHFETKYPKRRNHGRNYKDPAYAEWRKKIFARDDYKCQFPDCNSNYKVKGRNKLNAHHILSWSEYPSLRFEMRNGITLCTDCHVKIRGKEDVYVKMFLGILLQKLKDNDRKIEKGDV